MTIEFKFFKDSDYNQAKVTSPYEYAGGFLSSNISDVSAKKIIETIEDLQNGDLENNVWRCTYNSDSLTLTPSNAFIEPSYSDDTPCIIPIEDFKELLKGWLVFISE